jgi:hypothetical protein
MATAIFGKTRQSVDELTVELNQIHDSIIQSMRQTVLMAKRAGDILRNLKTRVGKHGQWQDWLKANFHASTETANCYMRVSQRWGRLERMVADNPKLTLEGALAAIRVPKSKGNEWPEKDLDRYALKETLSTFLDELPDADVSWLNQETEYGINRLDEALNQLLDERRSLKQ